MRIAVIGTGYVGLVSGACFSEFGVEVACVDQDRRKSRSCSTARCRFSSPGSKRLVAKNAAAGRLSFTTDLPAAVAGAEAVFIAVGTPSRRGDGHADLSYVHAAAEEIGRALTELRGGGHQVDGAGRHRPRGCGDPAADPAAGPVRCGLEPRISARGLGDRRLHAARPGGDRRRQRARPRGDARALSPALSARNADAVHRYRDRRTDQIRRQRVSRDQDHLYQRDRRSVRAGWRRRSGRGQGIGLDGRIGRKFLHAGPGFRRLLLSQGLPRAGAHRARGRGAAVDRRNRGAGQRPTQGAHGRQDHRRLRRQRRRQDAGRARA